MTKATLALPASILLAAVLLWGASGTVSPAAARTLQGLGQIDFLYSYLAGKPVDFEAAARNSGEYLDADEFDRPAVLRRIMDDLRARHEGMSEIDRISLRARSKVSEYDFERGAFLLDALAPGNYFPSGRYALLLDNAADFRSWVLPVSEARAVRDEIGVFRNVTVELDVRPFAAHPSMPRSIRGQIVAIRVFTPSGRLVHQAELDPSEHHAIVSAEDRTPDRPVDPDSLSLQGVRVGLAFDGHDGLQAWMGTWLKSNGYESYQPLGHSVFLISTSDSALREARSGERILSRNDAYKRFRVYGPNLDCYAETDRLESCGTISYKSADGTYTIDMVQVMQSAIGVTRQEMLDLLIARYGTPSDRFNNVRVLRGYSGEQFVWGVSGDSKRALTDVSSERQWQIEAVITQPEPDRVAVFVQLREVPLPEGSGGKDRIKF